MKFLHFLLMTACVSGFNSFYLRAMEPTQTTEPAEYKNITTIKNITRQPITIRYRNTNDSSSEIIENIEPDESLKIESFQESPITEVYLQMEGFQAQKLSESDISQIQGYSIIELTPSATKGFDYQIKVLKTQDKPSGFKKLTDSKIEGSKHSFNPASSPFPSASKENKEQNLPLFSSAQSQKSLKPFSKEEAPAYSSIHMSGRAFSNTDKILLTTVRSNDDDLKRVTVSVEPDSNWFGTQTVFEFVESGMKDFLVSPVDLTTLPEDTELSFYLQFFGGIPSVLHTISKGPLMQKLGSLKGDVELVVDKKGISFEPYIPRSRTSSSYRLPRLITQEEREADEQRDKQLRSQLKASARELFPISPRTESL